MQFSLLNGYRPKNFSHRTSPSLKKLTYNICLMSPTQKRYMLLGLLISAAYFAIFCWPNAIASNDINMVRIFEPDEAVPLPYVFDMIKPAASVKEALINFAFYDYYFYGYPYFAVSALSILPLALADRLGDIPLVMLILRQVVSVLPMLLAVFGLVYLQTRFRSYKSVVLLALLLSVPALVRNNFWWHPDSLAILFAVATIFFLDRDALRFGRNYYLAAAMCGISAQIKGIGFYFFLAVFVYLLIGFYTKKASLPRLVLASVGFLAVMALAYLAANPILIYQSVRKRFFRVMGSQARLLTEGYEIAYARGLTAAWREVQANFGQAIFLLTAFAAAIWGSLRGPRRLLNAIILAWAIPLTVMVFVLIHFKAQYWLPVMLPVFSSLVVFLPDRLPRLSEFKSTPQLALPLLATLVIFAQFGQFTYNGVRRFNQQLTREADSTAIVFAHKAIDALAPLGDSSLYVYHEVRMYLPPDTGWGTEAIFEMLDYDYIQQRNFDVVMVMQERIRDYINPNAKAIDAAALEKSRVFYHDAESGSIQGYTLAYRDDFGLVFVKNELYEQYFIGR